MEDKRTGTAARAYVGVELLADDAGGEVDAERTDESFVVVGVLTNEVYTAWSDDAVGGLARVVLSVELDGFVDDLILHGE